ncbi:unnamed protein product [Durusdinium trenchii]|uniref:DUF7869 domain-containing protein n=1 Tax=Durusdinium trenchii TaxID=1381693 RepID=A0ABP0IV38_9DINO
MATIVREGRLFPSGRCTQADCPKRRSLGTGRRQRIFQAAQKRAVSAPVDLRYVKRPYSDKKGKSEDCVRGDVVSFLGSLWASVAETLPDVRDDTFDDVDPEVSSRNIRSFVVQYLRSGHTHEDIDQTFGALSKHLLRVRDLQSPSDVVNTIKDFLQKAKMAWETERHVVMMDSIRDWNGFLTEPVPFKLVGIGGPGAPHYFKLQRRVDAGLQSYEIQNKLWHYPEHPDDVILRTKQWMASPEFTFTSLLYPRHLAFERLRLGVPAGLAEKRVIDPEHKKHLTRFLPALRVPLFGLGKFADWLEAWLDGSLEQCDLLDVTACLCIPYG